MPAIIQSGMEVRPYLSGDGTTQVRCPSCGHYIPRVAAEALTITEQRPTAAMIACRCPLREGTNAIGRAVECPCHAVFRLHPQGMQRYVVVEGWQEEATESGDIHGIELDGIVMGDGVFRIDKEVSLDGDTLIIDAPSSIVTLDDLPQVVRPKRPAKKTAKKV
jgi:hypothetical protein